MSTFLSSLRGALLGLVLLGGTAYTSMAQVQFASTVESSMNASNTAAAVDANITTAATLTPAVLGGGAQIRVGFATVVQPAVRTGLLLNVGGTLSASVFNTLSINTYTGASLTPLESFPLNSLVTLTVLNTGATVVEFPTTLAFDQVELVTTGAINLGFDIALFEAFTGTGPLPVELTAFGGKATPTGVLLTWNTASEHNSDHFIVERAGEQGEAFRSIGQVASAGNSSAARQYAFVDAAATGLVYYRLRQVDRDGQQVFSPVITVKTARTDLSIYPNPVRGTLTIMGTTDRHVSIFDQLGRSVGSAAISSAQPQVDVSRLPDGVYFLRDTVTGKTTKFIKSAGLNTPQ